MSQLPRPRRLKFAADLFDRFTRATHFHPDFTFSRSVRYVSRRVVLWTVLLSTVAYYALVAVADIGIYKKGADNRFTRLMEAVFPYPAAVAGGQVIPLSRFRKEVTARVTYSEKHQLAATTKDIQALVINQLIDKALYSQAASKYGITVTSADIDASLQGMYDQVGGKDKLVAFIKDNYGASVSMTDFRQWVRESLIESAIAHQALEHAEVSHVLIAVPEGSTDAQVEAARQKALTVKAKISSADQFGDIAKQYSEDISSRDKGGSLGTTVRGDDAPVLSDDFQNAVFSQPIGQVSDPVRSSYGWHLILVTSRAGDIKESMKQFTADLRGSGSTQRFRAFVGS